MPKNTRPYNQENSQRELRHTKSGARHLTSIGESLARLPLLRQRAAQAVEKQTVIDWLRLNLPAELAAHVAGAELQAGVLVVRGDAAAWSERLRYALAALGPDLTKRWPEVQQCEVKLQLRRP
jgi:hypothetical protein